MKLVDAIASYVDGYSGPRHAPATRRHVARCLDGFVSGQCFAQLVDVRMDQVEAHLARRARDVSPGAANNDLRYLKMLFNWAVAHELLERSPAARIRPFKVIRRAERFLSGAEIDRIIAHMEARARYRVLESAPPGVCRCGCGGATKIYRGVYQDFLAQHRGRQLDSPSNWSTAADMVRVIANTGLRLGEARFIRVGDVDLMARRLWVRNHAAHTLKDLEDRMVPLNDVARSALARRIEAAKESGPEALVFTSTLGKPLQETCLGRSMRGAALAAGVKGASWYALRHAFATAMAALMPELALAALMGHSNPATTRRYYVHRDRMNLPTPAVVAGADESKGGR